MATPRNNPLPLQDVRVLVCRPEPEARRLGDAFEARGARVRVLPALIREPLPETPEARQLIQNLDLFQHVLVVSPYAARQLLERLDTWWPQIPQGIRWYTVGRGTAEVLQEAGLAPLAPDSGVDSEALLASPELVIAEGDKVLIVRGEQGRELIHNTLKSRGARVTLLPLYRRRQPEYPDALLADLFGDFRPEVVITLSGETLNNFIALSENSGHNCRNCLLLVPVERIASQAFGAGFRHVCVPERLDDDTLVNTVIRALASDRSPD